MGMRLGEKIQRLRAERGLTQQELADRAGVSQAIISRLESKARHNVNADVLKGLAKALGCTTDYLVGMHEDDESELEPAAAALVDA
jgi:transcriptional regulator with XRE-family HTH domain